jgi:putative membrane protein
MIVSVALLLGSANPAVFAAETNSSPKEEVVYARLDAGGAVKGVYVVNRFGRGEVTDYGNYTSVKNLSTNDKISLDGDRVHFSSDADKVYYEGYLDNAEIPWDFSVRFFLDGTEYTADKIAGKSGALTIKIAVKRNKNASGAFFDNYALQMTAALNTETCENITADGATVVDVGENKQLSYVVLPGTEKEFAITADVKDFEMDPLSIGGVKMNLDIEFDESKLLGKVQEIQDAAAKLDDGAGGISTGAAKLKTGAGTFSDGTQNLQSGAAALESGVAELQTGILNMQDGINTLNSRSGALTSGSAQVKSALGQINAALSSVSAATGDITRLVSASSGIKDGIGSLSEGLESLKNNVSYARYKAAMSQAGLPDLSGLAAKNAQAAAGIDSLLGGVSDPALKQELTQLSALLKGNGQAFNGLDAFNKTYFGNVNSSVSQLSAGAATLKTTYAAFHSTISDFVNTLNGLLPKVSELGTAIKALSAEYDTLDAGITEYTNGVSAIAGGYSSIVSGVSQLAEGSQGLASGASGIHRASVSMTGGIAALLGGITELHGGTSEFRSKTSGMDTEITDEIDAAIASVSGGKSEIASFVSAQNENVTSVQFIIKTEAIKVQSAGKKAAGQEEPTTLWQKFVRLFKK